MPTVQNLIDDIDRRLPNSYTYAVKVGWMNDLGKKIYRVAGVESNYTFETNSTSIAYGMSTSMRIDKIKRLLVADCTASTNITSTTVWTPYKYAGADDTLSGNRYYRPDRDEFPTTAPSSQIALYPPTTDVYPVRVYFDGAPATLSASSSDSALLTPGLDEEYHDIYKYGVMEIIAKSGNAPDMGLGNNYHADYLEELKRIKHDKYKRKEKRPNETWSFQEWRR